MILDRNIDENMGRGKYAILKLRELENYESGTFRELDPGIKNAIEVLDKAGILDWGIVGSDSEFFLVRLKDKYANAALCAYADAASADDLEWASQVEELALRSGHLSPFCKLPD